MAGYRRAVELSPEDLLSYRRIAPVMFAVTALFLFGALVFVVTTERGIDVNPRVMGRVEQTWLVRDRAGFDRFANVTFTVIDGGKPINCEAKALLIGDASFHPNVGDGIELSPKPGGCARPYVIRIRSVLGVEVFEAFLTAVGFGCLLLAGGIWVSLSVS
jgi:hypothetical protein